MTASTIILVVLVIFLLIAFLSTFKVVPQRSVYIVERLGKYSRTLDAGFHILIPFIDKIAYRQNLKEQAIDVASQICITRDNIAVEVDGILYLQVIDPQKMQDRRVVGSNYPFLTRTCPARDPDDRALIRIHDHLQSIVPDRCCRMQCR